MKFFCVPFFLFFLVYNSYAQSSNPVKRLLIEDVSIIPMHINTVLEHKDVIIENGKIIRIRTHKDNDTGNYALGRVNGKGKYLLPSYANSHVHLPSHKNLETYFLINLINGVTTLRSMRGENWHLEIDKTAPLVPRLYLASVPISRQDELTEETATNLVSKYKAAGFDFIKILSVKDKTSFDNIAAASAKYQIPLAGHCPSNVGIFKLSESNAFQSIEHLGGFFSLRDFESIRKAVDATIAANIYHCPTLDWYYAMQLSEGDLRARKGVKLMPKEWVESWEKRLKETNKGSTLEAITQKRGNRKEQFKNRLTYLDFVYQQGGLLLLSPDASGIYTLPGYGVHQEIKHFKSAGISNYDILKASCYNLSIMQGEQNDWGTIKVGCHSDMVLLKGNPLENIENSDKIQGLILKGKYYEQEELLQKLKDSQN